MTSPLSYKSKAFPNTSIAFSLSWASIVKEIEISLDVII